MTYTRLKQLKSDEQLQFNLWIIEKTTMKVDGLLLGVRLSLGLAVFFLSNTPGMLMPFFSTVYWDLML